MILHPILLLAAAVQTNAQVSKHALFFRQIEHIRQGERLYISVAPAQVSGERAC